MSGWLRNYGAMGDNKLQRCVKELQQGYGDAAQRVKLKNGDLEENLVKAMYEARKRGLLNYNDEIPESATVLTEAKFCPECERKKKFRLNDYICNDCRTELDG